MPRSDGTDRLCPVARSQSEDASRAPATTRSAVALAAVGLVGSAGTVLCTAPLQAAGARRLLGPWDDVARRLAPWQREPTTFVRGGLVVVLAVLLLAGAWLLGCWLVVRLGLSTRGVLLIAALWAAPFALAPPVLSRDAYAYLAQGAVARTGEPYRSPQLVLHHASPFLQAMDPLYRNRVSPYGPLALRLFEGCLTLARGNGVVALLLLRLVVLICVCIAVWCAWQLAPVSRRSISVWLLAANPLVSMDLLGGLHLEALVMALLAMAFLLHARGEGRATALGLAAAAVKVTAVIAVASLIVQSFLLRGWRGLTRCVAAAVLAVGLLVAVLQPTPFGWVPAISSSLKVWDPTALPTLAALGWATVAGGSPVPVVSLLRPVFVLLGVAIACGVARRGRSLAPATLAGYVVAAVTLTGPVLWPWYVIPAVMLLVLGGSRGATVLVAALSVGAALTDLPMPVVQMQRVSAVGALCATVVALAGVVRHRRPSGGASARAH